MIWIVFGVTVIVGVLVFLTLAAVGHCLNAVSAAREDIAASVKEFQFQSRVTRKVLTEKVLPCVGYKEPEPLEEQLENAMSAFSSQLAKRSNEAG